MPSSAVTRFTDLYDFRHSIRGADVKTLVTTPGDYRAELTRVDLDRVWLQHARQALPQVVHFKVPDERSALLFLADDQEAPAFLSGMDLSPADLVCYSPGAEHHFRTSAACHWQTMSMTNAALAEAGPALAGRDVASPSVTQVVRPAAHLMWRLRGLHAAGAHLAASAPDILAHPEVAKAIEQELVRVMIACLTDPSSAESARSTDRRLPVMRRFERMIEANEDQPLYVTEVCAAIGVTDRTLRLHCQDHLGMSPHRYLWLRRMQMARRALAQADSAKKTVTEIANDYGFGELGRFAVNYRRLFGESPSTTLNRAA